MNGYSNVDDGLFEANYIGDKVEAWSNPLGNDAPWWVCNC